MANLIIDAGNTKFKYYLFEAGILLQHAIFWNEQEEEIIQALKALDYTSCIVSATGDIPKKILNVIGNHITLTHELKFPFTIAYETPNTLGSDRIALAAAAQSLYPKNDVLVIDAGTCITYDLIDGEGKYQGGAISPGLTLRLQSLNNYTDKLPLVDLNESFDYKLIGNSTKTSIQSGCILGAIAEVRNVIEQYSVIYKDLTVILTGGDHEIFALHLKKKIFADAYLQAKGLNFILEYNAL